MPSDMREAVAKAQPGARINGVFVLEIKKHGGTCSPKQKRWLKLLGRVDHVDAFAAWPEHWPRIRAYLEAVPKTGAQG